jgi:hypothetical protein
LLDFRAGERVVRWNPFSASAFDLAPTNSKERARMHNVFYLIGVIVVVLAVLSLL